MIDGLAHHEEVYNNERDNVGANYATKKCIGFGASKEVFGDNLTGSGAITGSSPAVSAGGYIGIRASPINISITGTFSVHAGGMNDYTSIAINGASSCNWQENMPGFVILNGNLQPFVGEQNFRQALIAAASALYTQFVPFNLSANQPQSYWDLKRMIS